MRQIASIKGKLYELREMTAEEADLLARANNFESTERFIAHHNNWRSTISERSRIYDSLPLATQAAGTARPTKEPKKKTASGKKRKNNNPRRSSKYLFKQLEVGDEMFIADKQDKISAAAGYFGRKCKPARFFSVKRREVDGVAGVIVKRKV